MVKRPVLEIHVYQFLNWIASGDLDQIPVDIPPGVVMWCHALGFVKIVVDHNSVGFELNHTGVEHMRDLAIKFSEITR